MKTILKLSDQLYIDLTTGECRNSELPVPEEELGRITGMPLRILNCLVANRECLCTKENLASLFDSETSEDKTVEIKQHIYSIKSMCKKADASLDGVAIKQIFQSKYNKGYEFHLPENGKIIKIRTSTESLIKVDSNTFRELKQSEEDALENIKRVFYGITGDLMVILKAACNELMISDGKYWSNLSRLFKYIFETKKPTAPVFLMGDGGCGKSSLLCNLAVQTANNHSGWNIYYLDIAGVQDEEEIRQIIDYMSENGISRTRKNLLCIDSPHVNPGIFRKLYEAILEKNDPYLYVVVAERTTFLLNLLESDPIYQRNSYIRGYYIDNDSKEGYGKQLLRASCVRFHDMVYCPFPDTLKERIIRKMIGHYSGEKGMDGNVVEQAMGRLTYKEKTITDIFLDFKRIYNQIAEQMTDVQIDLYIPRISMDWDEWKEKCRILDKDCTGLKMSEMFPYVAVCYIYGIRVTYEFLRWMTGFPYKSELWKIFPNGMGESIRFTDDCIVLRHDTVADNYFACHPEVSPQLLLEELVQQEFVGREETAILWNHLMPGYFLAYRNSSPFQLDHLRILEMLLRKQSAYYEEGAEDLVNRFIYVLHLFESERRELSEEETMYLIRSVFDDIATDEMSWINLWAYLFEISMQFCEAIPEELVLLLTEEGGEKRTEPVLNGLMNRYKCNMLSFHEEWNERYLNFLAMLCERLFKHYPEESLFPQTLGLIYTYQKKYKDAEEIYMIALKHFPPEQDKVFLVELIVDCYFAQMFDASRQYGIDSKIFYFHALRVGDITNKLLKIYTERKDTDGIIRTTMRQVYFYIKAKWYDKAFHTLEMLKRKYSDSDEKLHGVYAGYAVLFQSKSKYNTYYDQKKAIENYEHAIELLLKETDVTMNDSIIDYTLMLADIYCDVGDYGQARNVCDRALSIHPYSEHLLQKQQMIYERKQSNPN